MRLRRHVHPAPHHRRPPVEHIPWPSGAPLQTCINLYNCSNNLNLAGMHFPVVFPSDLLKLRVLIKVDIKQ